VPVEEFRQADEIFATSTAGGIIPVTRLDGRILGNDRPGPISERLREAYWAKRHEGWHAEPIDYSAAS
jgi:branched-chain amino acid aminotransferase